MRHRYTGAFPRLATLVGVLMCTVLVFSRMAIGETVSNIVLLIGDGMGFEQIRAGACFKGANLCFEAWPNRGEVRTHSANAATASSFTAMMDEPGRMSWNWLVSSVFQSFSSRAAGYFAPRSAASVERNSASRSASSDLRLPRLMAPMDVSVPR